MTKLFDISVGMNTVSLLGHQLKRPSHVSPSEWFDFWEAANAETVEDVDPDSAYQEGFREGQTLGRQEGEAKVVADVDKALERHKRRPPV